jgi:hypothetical protein
MSELYAQRGLDLRTEMVKRAKDFKFIKELADAEGLPLWMLYKPGFNWLQQGQGKPTASEVQMAQSGVSMDEPASLEETDNQPNS